jgi:hypothetical protein
MIIFVPVHTAECEYLAEGVFAPVLVAVHVSVDGSYTPPVFAALPV